MMTNHDRVVGTAGHIDHGKTALVRALTGVDTDRLPAEKQRGITIDLGFAALNLGNHRVALVDVPGHERFIRNMLAGATGLDAALLTVAADDSVMPQTREHLEILCLLGLRTGVIALTKCDLVDDSWLELVEEEVRNLVRETFLEGAPLVRTSAASGQGIAELREALGALCRAAAAASDTGIFRMAIDRAFTVAGHGTIVTGTIASGAVARGDDLQWLPEGRSVRVRGLQRHDQPVEGLSRGARAAINLTGVHHTEVHRGQELAAPGFLRPTRVVSVDVRSSAGAVRPLKHRARYRVHIGTADVSGVLSLLESNELIQKTSGLGQIFLSEPIMAVHGQPFVLRAESPPETLGGGRILQPSARRVRRRDQYVRDRLRRLGSDDPLERTAAALGFLGLTPWTDLDLCREAGLSLAEVEPVLQRLEAAGTLTTLPLGPRRSCRVMTEVVDELEDRFLRALGRVHQARPRQSSIRRSDVFGELPDLSQDALIQALIDRLLRQGRVVGDERSVALAGYSPNLSQAERRLKDEIARAIRDGGLSPPDLAELSEQAGTRAGVVPDLLALLVEEGHLVHLGNQLYLANEAESEMRRRLQERLTVGNEITMAELRDLLGTTRKYAVPIGEYLDRIGLTRREGDVRRLLEQRTTDS